MVSAREATQQNKHTEVEAQAVSPEQWFTPVLKQGKRSWGTAADRDAPTPMASQDVARGIAASQPRGDKRGTKSEVVTIDNTWEVTVS